MDKKKSAESSAAKKVKQPAIVWKDEHLQSTYANASNVVAGREEVVLLLGMNQSWQPGQSQVEIDLLQRIVMSPFAAKRLAIMLQGTLGAWEKQYGVIDIGLPKPQQPITAVSEEPAK